MEQFALSGTSFLLLVSDFISKYQDCSFLERVLQLLGRVFSYLVL